MADRYSPTSRPDKWRDTKTNKIITSKTNPNGGASTKTTKTGSGIQGSTTSSTIQTNDPVTTRVNLPNTKGLSKEVQDKIDEATFFGNLFTQNVTPRTVGLTPWEAQHQRDILSTGDGILLNSQKRDPFVTAGLQSLSNVNAQAGGAYGQEDQLYNQLAQGALQGFTPEQMQVARESGRSEITRGLNTAVRGALGQGANLGIFGRDVLGGAYPQMQMGANALGDLERDLFLQNIQRRDQLAGQALTFGDQIRRRRFGEQVDASGNLFQGGFSAQEADRSNQLNAFESLANAALGFSNQGINIQNINNDSMNAFELGKIGAFTGGLDYANTAEINNQILELQKKLANQGSSGGSSSGSGRRSTAAPTFTNSGQPNQFQQPPTQPAAPSNNNSAFSGSAYS